MRNSKWLALLALVFVVGASAQDITIGDFAEAQKAAIAADLAKLRGAAAPAPAAPASTPSPVVRHIERAPEPVIVVAGVSVVRGVASAEISVDGVPYMLEQGDSVPHTPYYAAEIGVRGVVLSTRPAGKHTKKKTLRFPLGDVR